MKKLALTYIILASVLWGTSGIFVHFLAPFGFSSLQMTFLRALVSVAALGIYILITNRSLFKANIKQLLLYIGSGVSFFLTASSYYISMQATSISTAVVLMYTAPIFVMIYSVAFFGERLTKTKTVAVVAMIAGCGLVSGIIGGLKFDLTGILFGFLSGISYSAYNIFTKIEMRKKCNPISATFYCFVTAVILGAFICNISSLPSAFAENLPVTVPLAIGIGIFTCVLPYFLYTLSLKVLPAGTASALGIIEPMAATVFSVIIFHEVLGIYSCLGIVLILGSVFLLSKSED